MRARRRISACAFRARIPRAHSAPASARAYIELRARNARELTEKPKPALALELEHGGGSEASSEEDAPVRSMDTEALVMEAPVRSTVAALAAPFLYRLEARGVVDVTLKYGEAPPSEAEAEAEDSADRAEAAEDAEVIEGARQGLARGLGCWCGQDPGGEPDEDFKPQSE